MLQEGGGAAPHSSLLTPQSTHVQLIRHRLEEDGCSRDSLDIRHVAVGEAGRRGGEAGRFRVRELSNLAAGSLTCSKGRGLWNTAPSKY